MLTLLIFGQEEENCLHIGFFFLIINEVRIHKL
jgi:hypothetical protein